MHLDESPEEKKFRSIVRRWLADNKPPAGLPPSETIEGFEPNREWERQLHSAGWSVVAWPVEFGGKNSSIWEWLIFEEEYFAAGLPQRITQNGVSLLAPAIFSFGTNDQKAKYLPRIASAEDIWCQGWSEPEAGSDLAGLRSRAERDPSNTGWRLYGQKTWTTRAYFSSRLFGLFRTDSTAERHRGLTYMLVDLDQPEIFVRPVTKLDGSIGFSEVFFDGAFVADEDVLGQVGGGWKVAMSTAGSERGLNLRSPGRFLVTAQKLLDLYAVSTLDGPELEDLRSGVIDSWMKVDAYKVATDWTVSRLESGGEVGAEASMTKIFWSEMDIALNEAGYGLLGADWHTDREWMTSFQLALSGPIYAGTNEIQRNIVAERVLGLPREG